ncbi:MAG: hypothetical protein R6U15_00965 [Candidatus Izemoplasmatales bacterium]
MSNILFVELYLLLFVCFSVLLHELGHYILIKYYRINYKIKISAKGIKFDFLQPVSNLQMKNILFCGIIFGLIPVFFSIFFHFLIFLGLLCIYLIGISNDVIKLKNLI